MARPSHDAAELARAALGELPAGERADLLIAVLIETRNLHLTAWACNRLLDHLNDLLAACALPSMEDNQ